MRRGVFFKLLGAFVLVIAVATGILDFAIRRQWEDSLREQIQRSMVEKTQLFARRVESDRSRPLEELAKEAAAAANARTTVIDRSGKVLAESEANPETMENHATRPEFVAALNGNTGTSVRMSHTIGVPFLYVAVPISGGAVRMAYPLWSVQQTTATVRRTLLIATVLALVFATLLAAWLTRLVSRRLSRIVTFAQDVAAGNLGARISDSSMDELALVTSALDSTAHQLQDSFSALQNSRSQLETLLNSMDEAVVAVSAENKVLWANGRMKDLGVPLRPGASIVESVRDPTFLAALQGALEGKQIGRARVSTFVRGRIFEATAAPMTPSGAVVVLHDITDLERVEKTRRDFIANVSHELRTPLTSVQGYAETLLDSAPADDPSREFLQIILKNAARMSRLTEDLLVLARVESGEQRFNMVATVPQTLLDAAAENARPTLGFAGMEFVVERAPAEAVIADPDAIHQVFANLIDNAIKYASGGKRLVLGAHSVQDGVEFFVRDFGPGIASVHHARLFERFYRVDKARSREAGGTGLGLAIVKHIVRAHGGDVRVVSELGHGSTFYFSLRHAPAARAALSAEPSEARSLA